MPRFLQAGDLVLCGESEEDLRAMVGHFLQVCRRGLKVNAAKSKVMVPNVEEGLECEVCANGMRLEHVSEFKYLGCILDEFCTDEAECYRKVTSVRRIAGGIRSLVNARVLHESLLMPALMHGSETLIWKEKERSRIKTVQMDNFRG